MKLYSFTTVKDEADIIESFVRYNMNILDGMIISDNGSNDNTLDILYKLKDEGYNIDIIEDKSKTFNQYVRRNELLQYTIKKYKPDYIFPLDADEFIATNNKCNPREIIEKLNPNKLYLYKMENYVLTKNSSDDLFIPEKITQIRNVSNSYEYFYKCIISNKIYSYSGGVDLASGAHNLVYRDGKKVDTEYMDCLFLAHYPVRSIVQYINKDISLALNGLRFHSRESGTSHHKYYILDKIIKYGSIPEKELYEFSKYYDVVDTKTDKIFKKDLIVGLKKSKLDYSFCKNIDIKYTDKYVDNSFILKNVLIVAKSVIDNMRNDASDKEIQYKKTIQEKDMCIEETNARLENYVKEYNNIINSKRWKLINKIFNLFGK